MRIFGDDDNNEPKLSPADAAVAAFDKGVEAANNGEVPAQLDDPIRQRVAPKAGEEDDGGEEDQDQDAGGEDAVGGDKGKPAGKPAAKAGDAALADAEGDQDEPDAAVEKEIVDLGLKGKTAVRFRELSRDRSEMAPIREVLTAAGITDFTNVPAQLEQMSRMAKFAEEWTQTIQSTGANDQQFGAVLGYLQLVNSGDPQSMQKAYDAMKIELSWLEEKLGIQVAGGADPLDLYPDLKEEVRTGSLDRKRAEELATGRNKEKAREKLEAEQVQRRQAQAQEFTPEKGVEAVKALANELYATDKEGFAARLKVMEPGIQTIQATMPPAKWEGAVRELWKRTPAPKVPKTKVGGNLPLRGTGNNDNMGRKPKDALDAFSMGVDAANNL
jgi:hypothetical protein